MFRASLCPSSVEQRPSYCIWCVVLVLLDVVGSGCGALRCRMRALLNKSSERLSVSGYKVPFRWAVTQETAPIKDLHTKD